MKTTLLSYLATLATLLILDVFYLGGFAEHFFESQLPLGVMAAKPVLLAAALFYLMYAAGVVFYLALPNAAAANLRRAALLGAGFGLVAYGTYDLTNMATINGWTWQIVIIDMCWGAVATAVSALAGTFVASRLMR